MSVILHIETASKNCSVALSKSGEQLSLKECYSHNFSHSEQLHSFIQELVEKAQMNIADLDAVAFSMGPGSFTGLRIGVAAAKGICFALDLPLIGINSLQILCEQYQDPKEALLFPQFDARRMEVYTMVLNQKKEIIKSTFSEVITTESFKEFSSDVPWIFMGEGAEKCKQVLNASHIEYRLDLKYPTARAMIGLAWQAFKSQDFEDVAYFEPFYLKDFYTTAKKIGP